MENRQAPREETMTPAASMAMLPQNVAAEESLLGSLLIDPAAVADVVDLLLPEDFYREAHRLIYAAALELYADGQPADLITLTDDLARRGELEQIGGVSEVSRLANNVPTSSNVRHYARIVHRTSLARQLIRAAGQIAAIGYHQPDAEQMLDLSMREILAVHERGQTSRAHPLSHVLQRVYSDILARMERDEVPGVRTGFRALDDLILALEPGQLIYVAGRPGMGKSAFGLKLAEHAAKECAERKRGSVDFITLEMSLQEQGQRIVAGRAEVNTRAIRAGFRGFGGGTDMEAHDAVSTALFALSDELGDVFYWREGPLSTAQLRAHVVQAVAGRGLRLVVIDQFDKLTDTVKSGDPRHRFNHLSLQLKQIAEQTGVVIVCLTQLSRNTEHRQNKRPVLSDLKESGNLEQDADYVWGIYRPAYYDQDATDVRLQQYAELSILKARSGLTRTVPLCYEAEYTRFGDWPEGVNIPKVSDQSDGR